MLWFRDCSQVRKRVSMVFLGVVLGTSAPTDGMDGDRGNVRVSNLPSARVRYNLTGPFQFRGRGSSDPEGATQPLYFDLSDLRVQLVTDGGWIYWGRQNRTDPRPSNFAGQCTCFVCPSAIRSSSFSLLLGRLIISIPSRRLPWAELRGSALTLCIYIHRKRSHVLLNK